MLWPAAADPESGYYVSKYLRDDFGTVAQLEAGLRDNAQLTPTPPAVLDRLLQAWRAMQPAAANAPAEYQVGGEWKAIVTEAFRPLTTALDADDQATLDHLLRNFMRRFGDFFGEPTNFGSEANKRARREQFQLYVSRWMDLFGEDSLPDAGVPAIGNPMGFVIDGNFYTADALRHHFYAHRMIDLTDDFADPIVCEVGGGFGGFARHLLSLPGSNFRYVDYDLPVICIAAAYYLMTALPDKRLRLYGEVDDLAEPLRDADLAILPNFALPQLGRSERRHLLQHVQLRRDGNRDGAGVHAPVRACVPSLHPVRGPQLEQRQQVRVLPADGRLPALEPVGHPARRRRCSSGCTRSRPPFTATCSASSSSGCTRAAIRATSAPTLGGRSEGS